MCDGLWALIQRCLEENPRRRPEVTDVILMLQSALGTSQDRACLNKAKMGDSTEESTCSWGSSRSCTGSLGVTHATSTDLRCPGFFSGRRWYCKLEGGSSESSYTLIRDSEKSSCSLQLVSSGYPCRCDCVRHTPPRPRNLLRKAGTWLLKCRTSFGHGC